MTEATPGPSNADLLAFMQSAFTHLATELATVKADVAETRAELAEVRADVAGVREELRGEIRASEARVLSRVASLQQVVQSVRADLSRHTDGTHPHGHAA